MPLDKEFRARFWQSEDPRPGDTRDEYQRDRARIIHSAGFRRLQAKTQVMGVGEGDFHRTRLTHSIEVGQIGEGLLAHLHMRYRDNAEIRSWLPRVDLVLTSCFSHDLGHPPYGHGGEKALHSRMADKGGFEGNGQTLRILTRLEKFKAHQGINPTRRLILAVLKYPIAYSCFDKEAHRKKPPKCYFDSERPIVNWALEPFIPGEKEFFTTARIKGKPAHRTFDATLMECADDIAYGVHDLEDIVARRLVKKSDILAGLQKVFETYGREYGLTIKQFEDKLFSGGAERKDLIGYLVNLFITAAEVTEHKEFSHPLLKYRVEIPSPFADLLEALKDITYDLVIKRAEVQQLERRGQRIIESLYDEFVNDPERLIPKDAWEYLDASDSIERRVCDYIAGMTDPFAEKIYRRLFVPGFGSSSDEL